MILTTLENLLIKSSRDHLKDKKKKRFVAWCLVRGALAIDVKSRQRWLTNIKFYDCCQNLTKGEKKKNEKTSISERPYTTRWATMKKPEMYYNKTLSW